MMFSILETPSAAKQQDPCDYLCCLPHYIILYDLKPSRYRHRHCVECTIYNAVHYNLNHVKHLLYLYLSEDLYSELYSL
jgi:hypothetical protein